MRIFASSKLLLTVVLCVLCLTLGRYAIAADPPATSPTPTPIGTCSGTDVPGLSGKRLAEHCESFDDPQSGTSGHPCRVIKDPLTGSYVSLMKAGKSMISSVVPEFIANSSIFNLAFDNSIASAKTLNGVLLNDLSNIAIGAYDKTNKDDRVREGYAFQFHFGCQPGNFCAQSMDLSSLGIEGDNLCIPDAELGAYISLKIADKNGTGPTKVGAINPLDLFTQRRSILARLNESANSTEAALSRLCFRSTPNGDRILNTIIDEQIKSSGNLPLIGALRTNLVGIALSEVYRSNLIDRFMNERSTGDYIRTNAVAIKDLVNKPLIGLAPDWFPTYKVQDAEMNSLWRCVSAAQEAKLFTAIGNLPVNDLGKFVSTVVFGFLLGVAGATTLLCVIYCAIRIQMSQGGGSSGHHQ